MAAGLYHAVTEQIFSLVRQDIGEWTQPCFPPTAKQTAGPPRIEANVRDGVSFPRLRTLFSVHSGKPHLIIANMPWAPAIHVKMGTPAYHFGRDEVTVPEAGQFPMRSVYYTTLFHELAHSTGHKKRLARRTAFNSISRYSEAEDYAKEEIVAEITACYLAAQAGFLEVEILNSARYLREWLQLITQPEGFLEEAVREARRAADFILGVSLG